MVSIGTILSIGIAGAVIAGGYALYRNLDKVGGAFSRGVEGSLIDPLGNYLDSLFQNPGSSSLSAQSPSESGESALAGKTIVTPGASLSIPGDTQVNQDKTVTSSTPPTMQLDEPTRNMAQEAFDINRFASKVLDSFSFDSQQMIREATSSISDPVDKSLTRIEVVRQSVDATPLDNKFYQLFYQDNRLYDEGNIIPLSSEGVQSFAQYGIIAREVYV